MQSGQKSVSLAICVAHFSQIGLSQVSRCALKSADDITTPAGQSHNKVAMFLLQNGQPPFDSGIISILNTPQQYLVHTVQPFYRTFRMYELIFLAYEPPHIKAKYDLLHSRICDQLESHFHFG